MVVRSKGVTIVYFTILVVYNDDIEPTGHLSLDKNWLKSLWINCQIIKQL